MTARRRRCPSRRGSSTEEERAQAIPPPAPSRPPWEDATPDGTQARRRRPERQRPEGGGGPAHRRVRACRGPVRGRAGHGEQPRGAGGAAHRLAGRRAARRPPRPDARAARGRARPPVPATGQAQQSEVDNAITAFADTVGGGLPEPWAGGLREAARCNAGMVPQALAGAVQAVVAGRKSGPPGWWRLVTAWQWLLTVLAAVGVLLSVVIAVVRLDRPPPGLDQRGLADPVAADHGGRDARARLRDGRQLPEPGRRRRGPGTAEAAERAMRDRVAGVTRDLVLARDRPGDRPVRAVPAGAGGGGGQARSLTVPGRPPATVSPNGCRLNPHPFGFLRLSSLACRGWPSRRG